MKVYLLTYLPEHEQESEREAFTNRRKAKRRLREVAKRGGLTFPPTLEAFDIPITAAGVVRALDGDVYRWKVAV